MLTVILSAASITLCIIGPMPAAKAQINLPTEATESSSTPDDLRERLRRLQEGAQAASESPVPDYFDGRARFPTLGSTIFDAQLARYLAYVEAVGTPDVLIVGSSRALQGIDPTELRYRLSVEGYDNLKVYNFGVNGATAQVVNFIVSELLPGELPEVIVWGDGSRAFNEGRRDRTWESLLSSAGYQSVLRGEKPAVADSRSADSADSTDSVVRSGGSLTVMEDGDLEGADLEDGDLEPDADEPIRLNIEQLGIDRLGFVAVRDRFNPAIYYRQFARVQGRYDGAYSSFTLGGSQSEALAQLAAFLSTRESQLIFVNLPLSDSYLDSYRLRYENRFKDFLVAQRDRHGFELIDLLTQWRSQPELFADPSHINQYGAAAIAQQLARHSTFLLTIDPAINPAIDPAINPAIDPVRQNDIEPSSMTF
ncbi:MAG: hypothetical protein AAF716_04215 [Cyanobacteria bacterium P01_D01_bin.1]